MRVSQSKELCLLEVLVCASAAHLHGQCVAECVADAMVDFHTQAWGDTMTRRSWLSMFSTLFMVPTAGLGAESIHKAAYCSDLAKAHRDFARFIIAVAVPRIMFDEWQRFDTAAFASSGARE